MLILAASVLAAGAAPAQDRRLEDAIVAAMKSGEGAPAIKGLVKAGYVKQKPNRRVDYVDYRAFRKPLTLAGATLVTIEEEYMTKHIGCCVNEGIGLVARVGADPQALTALAKAANCAIKDEEAVRDSLANAGARPGAGGLVYISCRSGDRR